MARVRYGARTGEGVAMRAAGREVRFPPVEEVAEHVVTGVRQDRFYRWFRENEEGLRAGWDSARRLKELDGDGIAAEVVFPDADAVASRTAAPFGVGLGLSGDQDPEPGMAGAQAHNRWLADFVSAHPERHCGVALGRRDQPRVRAGGVAAGVVTPGVRSSLL